MKILLKAAYNALKISWFFTRPVTVGVRVMMVRDGQVVLVRHTYQDAWFMPGGGVKRGESLEQAARREAREECGAKLGALRLVGAFSQFDDYKSDHLALFFCTDFTMTGKGDFEIERTEMFPLDQLPDDISSGVKRRIEEYRRGETVRQGMW